MFIEMMIRVEILGKFDQNPINHVEEITQAAATRDVQNRVGQFHKSQP
jgi:hypothetical protein